MSLCYQNYVIIDLIHLLICQYQNGVSIQTFTPQTILNNTPNVSKKYGLSFACSTSIIIMIDYTTYYKYDIDLRNYTKTKTTSINSPYRIFTIRIWFATAFFEVILEFNIFYMKFQVI